MNRYFIIHGSTGNPFENWFPWLQEKLAKQGKEVFVPQFPSPEGQNYNNWSCVLKSYLTLGLIDENTVFICHSLAPIFICKFLIENKIKVKGIISVSGFNELLNMELDKINKTFLLPYSELEKINNYIDFIYCYYSDNDPYIPQEQLKKFIQSVKGEKCFIKGAGHFNTSSGYNNFPEILETILQSEGGMAFMEDDDMPIGINAIILNEKGQILLAQRKNRYGAGSYSLIGGKLKKGETFESCMVREIEEEIGIKVKEEDLEIINMGNTIKEKHFVQIGILVKKYEGNIENKEPHKCADLQFFDLENLPDNLFSGTKPNIELFIENKFYDKSKNIILK